MVVRKNPQIPNILLIVLDTVRADHLSCYGYSRETTPFLDSLAAEGTRYTQAISPAIWTLPTHVSLHTGLYPSSHGTDSSHQKMDTQSPSLAELLAHNGYETAGFAAAGWLSEMTRFPRGFETFCGPAELTSQTAFTPSARNKLLRVIQKFWAGPDSDSEFPDKKAQIINRSVMSWLENRDEKRPFFAFINFFEAHSPYLPPPPYHTRFLDPEEWAYARTISQRQTRYYDGDFELSSEDFRMLKDLYDGELSYLDHRIGELFGFLKKKDILDDTLCIITADHGENLGEKNHFGHRYCLYNTLIHVPLLIRYPEIFPAGHVEDTLVQSLDIFPTVMELALPDHARRQSSDAAILVPSALKTRKHPFAVSEKLVSGVAAQDIDPDHARYAERQHSKHYMAIIRDSHKLIWVRDGLNELYDLSRDPTEERNLIHDCPEKAEELLALIKNWKEEHQSQPKEDYSVLEEQSENSQIIRELKALGYLDETHQQGDHPHKTQD